MGNTRKSTGLISVERWINELNNSYETFYICPVCEKGKALKKPYFKYFTEVYGKQELERIAKENRESAYSTVEDAKKAFWESMSKFGYKSA